MDPSTVGAAREEAPLGATEFVTYVPHLIYSITLESPKQILFYSRNESIMSINHGNIFSALSLSNYMYRSLPKEPSPQLRNPFDAIALLSHACMLAVGFRLVGLGEDHRIGENPLMNLFCPSYH